MWTEIEKKEEPSLINSDEEIDEFEGRHGVNLPEDHRQFLKEFGQGVIFNYIRIWGIEKINSEYKEFQTRWSEYFLWEDPNSQLSEDELKNCIIIADSFNGDELVISPKHKNYM